MYYEYESAAALSRRGATFLVVVLFHILLAVALYSGLGVSIVKQIVPPWLNISSIEHPAAPEPLPLPLPMNTLVKPYVPQPWFTAIDSGESVDSGIQDTQHSNVEPRTPPVPSVAQASTPVSMDPRHPLKIGREYYPDGAVRAEQEGRCVVSMTVAADGRVRDAAIQTSSGFALLDQACIDAVRNQRMIAATRDGAAVESTVSIPILWRLSNR